MTTCNTTFTTTIASTPQSSFAIYSPREKTIFVT